MVEQPLIVEVIKLTLNHAVYVTRQTKDVAEATAARRQACSSAALGAPPAASAGSRTVKVVPRPCSD
jgi:hypothetical protein